MKRLNKNSADLRNEISAFKKESKQNNRELSKLQRKIENLLETNGN